MRSSTLGNILYDNFVISIPQLMEISSIYSHENFKEVSQLITRVLEAQPKYIYDIEKSTRFIGEVRSSKNVLTLMELITVKLCFSVTQFVSLRYPSL